MRRTMIRVLAPLLGLALLSPATTSAGIIPPEFENWFVSLPSFSANTFTIILQGDQTSLIPPQDATQSLTNPFAYLSGSTSISVKLDSDGNTDIVYTGPAISPSMTFPYPNGDPHFGLNNGVQPPGGFQVLSETWSDSSTDTLQLPGLSFATTPQNLTGLTTFQFLTFFAEAGGVGTWFEVPYIPGQPPMVQLTNNNLGPLTLSNAGYFLSDTQIPLDNLNFADVPPPGSSMSPFIPLPNLDGTTLAPGGSINASVPEPATVIGLVQGLVGLAGFVSVRVARRRTLAIVGPSA